MRYFGSIRQVYGKGAHSASNNEFASTGYGTVEALEANYNEWEAQYVKEGGDRNWVIPIGWFKGLSTEHTYASGKATLNLIDGTVSVECRGASESGRLGCLAG